jgi:CRISPR/Cas system-associated protein Csx1
LPKDLFIPMLVVKQCMDYIIKPLVHICNVSFQQGIFRDQMKIAKIKPLYRNGDKQDMQNYRPISVLSAFSKILEKLMYNRLSFLKKHQILTETQHGFIENKSTETASQSFIESVHEAVDNQWKAIGI